MRRINGSWQDISWDQALDFIAHKLARIKEEHGAKAVVVYSGDAHIGGQFPRRLAMRFCSLYGTPNFTAGGSLCFFSRLMGHGLTLNHKGVWLAPSFDGAKCIVAWGLNPAHSDINMAAAISRACKDGAKLIVIDPRATSLAKKADIYAQIKPGTDCALALGLINVIVAEGLFDRSFVQDWTIGFEKLVSHIRDYTPRKVSEITWIPEKTIFDIARAYAGGRPATIAQGVSSDPGFNGVQTSRAIAILVGITGNLDIPGGNVYQERLKLASLKVEGQASPGEVVSPQYPLFTKFAGHPTVNTVPDNIISGKPYPVRALIVQGGNPMATWPDINKVKDALSRLKLLVVSDLFLTETARLAHVFLPAATFLEGQVLRDDHHRGLPLLVWGERVIAPLGNSIPDWRMWCELGARMGYKQHFPWDNDEELFHYLLQPSGISLDHLKGHPGGVLYHPVESKKYLREGFSTPSGKMEIYSQLMEQYGYPPLPSFQEPEQRIESKSEIFPMILTTGARVNVFTHSQYRNIVLLRKHIPEPLAEINSQTAKALDIQNGDMITLQTKAGSISLKAKTTEDIHPRVISIQHGWPQANANILTGDVRDPVSGYPDFRSIPCRVTRG